MKLNTTVEDYVDVAASPDEVMALISVVPKSAQHFPGVEALDEEEKGWRWTLSKVGVGPVNVQTVYGCEYQVDMENHRMRWRPLKGVGNAELSGGWMVEAQGDGSRVHLRNTFEVDIPVPKLMKKMAQGVVDGENRKQVKEYLSNLKRTLEGGDGRVSLT